jgi:XRE family transcriptional regulator, regulator of sulfur utilization
MKFAFIVLALSILTISGHAHAPPLAIGAEPKLTSRVFSWSDLPVEKRPNGVRRPVLDGPTTTLDLLHAHVTTLEPGQVSGEPRLHPQEEVIIVKEGTVEAHFDGQTRSAGPGSLIFFAANAVTFLKNSGAVPATYHVIYYYTPLTPKAPAAGSKVPR